MKRYLIVAGCFISLFSFGQYADDPAVNSRIAFLLNKFNTASLDSTENAELKNLSYKIQNKAFHFEQNLKEFDSSLIEIDKALLIWTSLRDTINEANLRKFRGYLLGHLKKFPEAKKEIHQAINLYTQKKRLSGAAVSAFDMALVYEMESLNDSAIYFSRSALKYWIEQKDTFRIFDNVNLLMHLLMKVNRPSAAQQLQQESEPLLHSARLHWRAVIDFYYLSAELYKRSGPNDMAARYAKLYEEQREKLRSQNITPITRYISR